MHVEGIIFSKYNHNNCSRQESSVVVKTSQWKFGEGYHAATVSEELPINYILISKWKIHWCNLAEPP